jgi:hypothetical protein
MVAGPVKAAYATVERLQFEGRGGSLLRSP